MFKYSLQPRVVYKWLNTISAGTQAHVLVVKSEASATWIKWQIMHLAYLDL